MSEQLIALFQSGQPLNLKTPKFVKHCTTERCREGLFLITPLSGSGAHRASEFRGILSQKHVSESAVDATPPETVSVWIPLIVVTRIGFVGGGNVVPVVKEPDEGDMPIDEGDVALGVLDGSDGILRVFVPGSGHPD